MVAVTSFLLAALAGAVSVNAEPGRQPPRPPCAADRCFAAACAKLPPKATPVISGFCERFIKTSKGTVTVTATATRRGNAVTPTPVVITRDGQPTTILTTPVVTSIVTVTNVEDQVSNVGCSTVVESPFPTSINYRVRGSDPAARKARGLDAPFLAPELDAPQAGELDARELGALDGYELAQLEGQLFARGANDLPSNFAYLGANCGEPRGIPAKVSSACSCFLTSRTRTVTATQSIASTAPAATVTVSGAAGSTVVVTAGEQTSVTTVFVTATNVATTCTSTATETSYTGVFSCGIANPTEEGAVGTPTCANDAVRPGETNAPFRIEGGSEGSVFDGCIVSGPRNITTPSGGTHLCDGTNNNANPAPGATLTTDIDSAGRQEGFGFDGSYNNQFQDFFISSISSTTQTGNAFWGVLRNRVFTARGGCQEQVSPADEGLWAFDAFAPNRVFLSTSPGYQVVRAGTTFAITVTILAGNPNSGNTVPAAGATFGQGPVAGPDGSLQVIVPTTPGCYQYKAEGTNAIRSNAFYLTVLPAAS